MRFNRGFTAIALAASLALAAAPTTANAQQRTVESAHQFITQMLGKGVSLFSLNDNQGAKNGYAASISTINSQACTTYISGSFKGNAYSRRIDWSKASQIFSPNGGWETFNENAYFSRISVQGAIDSANGSVLSEVVITTDSGVTSERLVAAMNYLREACDTSESTGF